MGDVVVIVGGIEVKAAKPLRILQCSLTNEMGSEVVRVQKTATFLRLDDRFSQIYLWYLVDPDEVAMVDRKFHKYGPNAIVTGGTYRGTAMLNGRILHVFEE